MMQRRYLCTIALGVAALATLAAAQTVADHDKVVSCYVGTWAFYRY